MDIRTTYCMIDTKTYWWVFDLVGKLVGWRTKKNGYRPFLRQSSGRITFVLKRAGFVLFRNLQFIRWTLSMPWSTISYTFKVHWFTCYSYSNRHLHGCFKNNMWQNVCSGNVAHPNWHLVNYNLKYVSCMCSFLVFIYLYSYLFVLLHTWHHMYIIMFLEETCRSWLSPSNTWMPSIKLRLSGIVVNTFTCYAFWLAQLWFSCLKIQWWSISL